MPEKKVDSTSTPARRPSPDQAVALSGCGWVTPLAAGPIAEVLNAASKPIPPVDARPSVPIEQLERVGTFPAEIKQDRAAWMAAAAIKLAARSAGIHLSGGESAETREAGGLPGEITAPERVGLVLGCGLAGQAGMIDFAAEVRQQSARFVSPIHFPQTVGNYPAGALSRAFDIRGPNVTIALGLASGLEAIIEASSLVASGEAEVIFAGGVEALSEVLASGLDQPGVTLSEGACVFVVERLSRARARGTCPLAVVSNTNHSDERSTDIVSVAGFREPGAVFIEAWIGRCIGAAGAAATAAAIAAARGLCMPMMNETDTPTNRGTASQAPEHGNGNGNEVYAQVLAGERRDCCAELKLLVLRN